MTLSELIDAIDGDSQARHDDNQIYLWGVRRVIFHQVRMWTKDIKEEEIFPLEIDDKIREERYKNMPKMTVKKL